MTLALPPLVRKEVRALAPIWAATTAALAFAGGIGFPLGWSPVARTHAATWLLGLLAFVLGAMALGAMSIGHEYAHRTLAQLLSQPDDRGRLFRIKRTVLALLLVALTGVAAVTLFRDSQPLAALTVLSYLVLVPLLALSVAPWLTMACRSPLAGIVFTLAVPAALWLAGDALSPASDGASEGVAGDRIRFGVLWAGVLAASAAAALASRRAFLRLEARDGHGEAYAGFPGSARARASAASAGTRRPTRPLPALVRKEIHLQSATVTIALMYAAIWAALSLVTPSNAGTTFFYGLTVLYCALAAMLAGAIPSAEERSLGTNEWQTLQPYAVWRQWAVKAALALALGLGVTMALPLLLNAIHPILGDDPLIMFRATVPRFGSGDAVSRLTVQATTIGALVCCGLYLSSLCASGVRALLLALPMTAVLVTTVSLTPAIDRLSWDLLGLEAAFSAIDWRLPAHTRPAWIESGLVQWSFEPGHWIWLSAGAMAGFSALLVSLGGLNHRSAERPRARIARQLLWLAVYMAVAVTIGGAGRNLLIWVAIATS